MGRSPRTAIGKSPEMSKEARYWVDKLRLIAHPEGGHYRQSYRSDLSIARAALPRQFTGARSVSTAIYFLLEGENFSGFHRLRSDELWHFYTGNPLLVHVIEEEGRYSEIQLGTDLEAGQNWQAVVKAGCWFASCVRDPGSFALVGCTVAPGFEFEDFELGEREGLTRLFPQHRDLIQRFTRL